MNELIIFIKDHPHCTKWRCTTCGGLWSFIFDFDRWLVDQQVNLVDLLLDLEPSDLFDIPEWPVFLDLVLEKVPKEAKDDLKRAWQSNLGRFLEFDIIGIRHFKSGSFDPCIDTSWFNLCRDAILYGIQREEKQGKEIEDCLRFLGPYTDQYPEFLEMKQYLVTRQQAAELYQRQHEQAEKAGKKQKNRHGILI
jgi:hypothetical protein